MRYLLILTCTFLIPCVYSQKTIAILEQGNIYAKKVHNDYAYFMVGGNNQPRSNLYRMKLPNGTPEAIDTSIIYCQSVIMGDSGVFYISFKYAANGNDGEHYLNYMPYGGQKRVLKTVNQYVQHPNRTMPSKAVFQNGRYFINTWFNNKNCIWESDGSEVGTNIVFQSSQQIMAFTLFQDKPIAILNNGNKIVYIENYQNLRLSPDYKQFNLSFFHITDSICIYQYNKKLYIIHKPGEIDSVSLALPGLRIFKVVEGNDSIVHGYNYVEKKLYTYKLRIIAPYSYDSIRPATSIDVMDNPSYQILNNEFIPVWNFSTGYEMAFAPFNDSMRLIKDLNPGSASSVYVDFGSDYLLKEKEIAYFSANNGSNGKYYLYSSNGHYLKSHFPWGNISNNFQMLFLYDSLFYWTYRNTDTLFIAWHSLQERDTQPSPQSKFPSTNKGGEWLRTASPAPSLYPYTSNSRFMQSHAVKTDKAGNVIVCGISRNLGSLFYLRFSDTTAIQQLKGDQMVIKYDSGGRLLWSKTLGGFDQSASLNPSFHVDKYGDIIVFGNFYQKAMFDSIELNTPRAALYLCKLDGNNGKMKWVKQFNPTYYSNDNTSDNLVSDREGNLYISFTFTGFSADFEGTQINTDRSPANGLVKLDKVGNVLWAKGNETPWTDKYGLSRAMVYDSLGNVIYNLIGQGFYNWWASCRYAPFRNILYRISKDGDIQTMQSLEGNDLNSATTAILTKNNSVFISGFYRSRLDMSQLSVQTFDNNSSDCHYENFYATVSTGIGRALGLGSTNNDAFYPFDICSDAQYIYVLGSEKKTLCIRRYTHLGRYAGKRLFKDCYTGDPFDFNFYFNINVSGSYFLLSMSSNSRIKPFSNFVEQYEGLSVYRILKDKNWTESVDNNETISESGIILAPNPALDYINLYFNDPLQYNRLDFYDALGRPVKTVIMKGETYQTIPLQAMASGMYFLLFSGRNSHTEKLIIR